MGRGEGIYEVSGRASGKGLDKIGEVGDRAGEGQAACKDRIRDTRGGRLGLGKQLAGKGVR